MNLVVTPDAESGGTGEPGGGSSNAGRASTGGRGGADTSAAGSNDDPGAAGSDATAGAGPGPSGDAGAGGEIVVPDPMSTPPTITAVLPKDKAVGVEPASPIRISFSEPLDAKTVTSDTVQVLDEAGALVSGGLSYANSVVTFKPAARLSLIGGYTVNVSTAVTDANHTPLSAAFSSGFRVREGAWDKAETSLTSNTSAFDSVAPLELASDGGRHGLAVWAQVTKDTYDVYGAAYDEATGWATPVKLNTNAARCQYPSVAMNSSGAAVVGWTEYDATLGYSIQARRYVAGIWDAASTKIDQPTTAPLTTYPSAPAVAITEKGDAHVVWNSYYYDSTVMLDYYGVYARHATPAGVWDATTPSLTYSQSGSAISVPTVSFDAAGNGFAAYQFSVGTPIKTTTIVERFVAATGKWGVSAAGAAAADGYATPVAVSCSPAGEAVVAWQRNTADASYDLMASHYNKAWTTPVVISSATTALVSSRTLASTAWTGSSFLVAWAQSAGALNDIYANEYKAAWGTAAIVSDGNHSSLLPRLASDGRGNALAIWYQQSDTPGTLTLTPTDVVAARFLGGVSKWAEGVRVSNGLAGYRYPRVATLADGSALGAWQSTARNGKLTSVNGVLQNGFQ